METLKKTVKRAKWLGVDGVMTVYHLDKKRDGLCVVLMELEGQPATVRLMSGDARTPNYKVYAEGEL
jgi:hypothetical protein